jgi:hypothetical protein
MNKPTNALTIVLMAFFLCIQLLGCGNTDNNQVAGIDGSGAPVTSVSGTVNGFGSVIVNGVHYNSDKTNILVNGIAASENDLRTGYQVKVTGTLNNDGTGNADTLEFRPTAVGTISQINLQTEQLTLLGQTVQINNATVFGKAINPNYLNGLSTGSTILVSGQLNNLGVITATRIDLTQTSTVQVTGVITNLSDTAFNLNGLTVNFSAARREQFETHPLRNGLLIHAQGSLDNAGILQAQILTHLLKTFTHKEKSADIEGFVTRFDSSNSFDIDGTPCTTNNATLFDEGTQADLILGAAVKIKGELTSTGALLAKRIVFRTRVSHEIVGEVSSVTANSGGVIITGGIQLSGNTTNLNIKTTAITLYEDNDSELHRFNFSSIQPGDFIKIAGYTVQNYFIAIKIEREKFNAQVEQVLRYEGEVTQVELHNFTVLNHKVFTNENTDIKNINGETISEEQFSLLALNQHLRVEGVLLNNIFTATEIEIRELHN